MIEADHFARLVAFLEFDPADAAKVLAEENGIPVKDARQLIDTAIRERQERDVSDTHTELLDEQAKEQEHGR